MTVIGEVSELWRYPVSSTGGERLGEAPVAAGGVAGDRHWGVVDLRDGTVAGPETRRHWRPVPNLASRLGPDGPQLRHGDGPWLAAGSAEADALVTGFLGFPAALRPHVPFGTERADHVAPRYARADLHVLTTASMRTLGDLLGDPAEVDTRRFRPNLVIDTTAALSGFVEHGWVGKRLAVGDLTLSVAEPCARCAFTSLAQGELAFEPAVLHQIARHGDGGFGVLCAVEAASAIRIGDAVRLIDG
jgi:uncharacterized protein YcbX